MASYTIYVHGTGSSTGGTRTSNYTSNPNISATVTIDDATRSGTTVKIPVSISVGSCNGASYFGYTMKLYARIGTDEDTQKTLVSKDASPSQWSSGKYSGSATLSTTTTGTSVTISIYMKSNCTCSQSNTTARVWYITTSVPAATATVKFYKNNGSWASGLSDPQSVTTTIGSSATISANPTRDNYTFKEWNTKSGGSGTSYSGRTITNVSADMSVYAQWTRSTYTVTYDTNGGSGGPSSPVTVNAGSSYTISSTKPTGKSYTVTFNANGGTSSESSRVVTQTFKNWNTNSSGTGTSYSAGAKISSVTSNITLYAIYTDPTIGTLPTATRYNEITEDDDTCIGWSTTSSGGTYVSSSTTVSSNTTIYAQYNIYITYYYNADAEEKPDDPDDPDYGGDLGVFAVEEKTYGVSYKIMSDYPVVPKLEFDHWNTKADGTGTSYKAGDTYSTDASLDLYAQYNPGKYTVTFDANGGSFASGTVDSKGGTLTDNNTKIVYYNVTAGNSAGPPTDSSGNEIVPTRSRHSFLGWQGRYTDISQDTTVKAMWTYFPIWIQNSNHEWEGFR